MYIKLTQDYYKKQVKKNIKIIKKLKNKLTKKELDTILSKFQ